ncbi:MAG: LysM peptidoglycan-binding domain-containing protein [Candidatus Woesebacteria bacterium]|jgi:nucleoid-associated protein YgaU
MNQSTIKYYLKVFQKQLKIILSSFLLGIFSLAVLLVALFTFQKENLCYWLKCQQQPAKVSKVSITSSTVSLEDESVKQASPSPTIVQATIKALSPTPSLVPSSLSPTVQREEKIASVSSGLSQSQEDADLATPQEQDSAQTKGGLASGRSYTIQKGDSLWKIAEEQLGDSYRWVEIYQLNRAVIGNNPDLIYPQVNLVLPS